MLAPRPHSFDSDASQSLAVMDLELGRMSRSGEETIGRKRVSDMSMVPVLAMVGRHLRVASISRGAEHHRLRGRRRRRDQRRLRGCRRCSHRRRGRNRSGRNRGGIFDHETVERQSARFRPVIGQDVAAQHELGASAGNRIVTVLDIAHELSVGYGPDAVGPK